MIFSPGLCLLGVGFHWFLSSSCLPKVRNFFPQPPDWLLKQCDRCRQTGHRLKTSFFLFGPVFFWRGEPFRNQGVLVDRPHTHHSMWRKWETARKRWSPQSPASFGFKSSAKNAFPVVLFSRAVCGVNLPKNSVILVDCPHPQHPLKGVPSRTSFFCSLLAHSSPYGTKV